MKIAKKTDCYLTHTFTGSKIEWISAKAPVLGKANIYIDNVLQKPPSPVDLYASSTQAQYIAFAKSFGSSGTHTIKISAIGKKSASSKNSYVPIDAFNIYP